MHAHKIWLQYAEDDLTIAKQALFGEYVAVPTALSLSQQAAEKAIKAYLVYKNHNFMKTHRLELLIDQCLAFDQSFEELRLDATALSPHVTISRYPDSVFGLIDIDCAEAILLKAEKIVVFIKEKI